VNYIVRDCTAVEDLKGTVDLLRAQVSKLVAARDVEVYMLSGPNFVHFGRDDEVLANKTTPRSAGILGECCNTRYVVQRHVTPFSCSFSSVCFVVIEERSATPCD
jgi:hypothetical protein